MMNVNKLIKTIEELREKYRKLSVETTNKTKKEKYLGVRSALTSVINDLKDIECDQKEISKEEVILILLDYREEYSNYLEEELELNNPKNEIKYKSAISAFGALLTLIR